MIKVLVEVNEAGELYVVLPEEMVEQYQIEPGDRAEWDDNDGSLELFL